MDLTNLKPWELIRLAVQDMKATIASGYTIYMSSWGKNVNTPECSVCFAGAIMLQRDKEACLVGSSFEPSDTLNEKVYEALDSLRKGDIRRFLNRLNLVVIKNNCFINFNYINFKAYTKGNEEEFYSQMEDIASLLEFLGFEKLETM